jgi:hypothetical protein
VVYQIKIRRNTVGVARETIVLIRNRSDARVSIGVNGYCRFGSREGSQKSEEVNINRNKTIRIAARGEATT